jgi:pimeloyl-ACP methyl ester carboxylesterase
MNSRVILRSARLLLVALLALGFVSGRANAQDAKPTVVLVHGAFAESSSWNGVITQLIAKGYPVVAVANPWWRQERCGLRDYRGRQHPGADRAGRPLIRRHAHFQCSWHQQGVKALVYVSAFASMSARRPLDSPAVFPEARGPTLAPPIALPDGGKDLYIVQDKFRAQFAADVPEADVKLMAATQRPITEAALNEASATAAWKTVPRGSSTASAT